MNVYELDNLVEVDYSNHLIHLLTLKFCHYLGGQKQLDLNACSFCI